MVGWVSLMSQGCETHFALRLLLRFYRDFSGSAGFARRIPTMRA
jgi:hypothetical protein